MLATAWNISTRTMVSLTSMDEALDSAERRRAADKLNFIVGITTACGLTVGEVQCQCCENKSRRCGLICQIGETVSALGFYDATFIMSLVICQLPFDRSI